MKKMKYNTPSVEVNKIQSLSSLMNPASATGLGDPTPGSGDFAPQRIWRD